jgi:hypothetical protein
MNKSKPEPADQAARERIDEVLRRTLERIDEALRRMLSIPHQDHASMMKKRKKRRARRARK